MDLDAIKWVPWIPAAASVLCLLCCMHRELRRVAGTLCVLGIFFAFALSASNLARLGDEGVTVKLLDWIQVGALTAPFSYYIDGLTVVMLMLVTGVGALIALYATGYMKGDRGYARFFTAMALFIFAMTTLVMADNLVLMFLGWEGVGLCSYLLIGFYYDKPTAVAAAKKAFIVNRIGDFGFLLGIFLTYQVFGTVNIPQIVEAARQFQGEPTTAMLWIPFLLMLGAFGKSAQLPLFVWLPDAMAGPTPVSALVHAATMVTSGVYLVARLFPVFELSPCALPVIAAVGGATALFAATIALCSNDLKGVFAYSTVSQLGYMFLGVGALGTEGGVYHLFTHGFFKALLFLTAGSVMHAMAGQLDIRKMSGLRHKMPVTCWLMFCGCLALAGFPLTAGFFSKDMILADVLARGLGDGPNAGLYMLLAWIGFFTAFLTAFYTFRLWFRVFMGPEHYEMGEDHHATEEVPEHAPALAGQPTKLHGSAPAAHGHTAGGHDAHAPHEMPWFPMNAPLVLLAVGAIFGGFLFGSSGWMHRQIERSTAVPAARAHHAPAQPAAAVDSTPLHDASEPTVAGAAASDSHAQAHDDHAHHIAHVAHVRAMVISIVLGLSGILLAAWFHWLRRPAADRVASAAAPLVTLLRNKYYVDEFYDLAIVRPLRASGRLFYAFDTRVVDGLVQLFGALPRMAGMVIRPAQSGRLQGYALGMICGAGMILFLLIYASARG